MISIGSKRSRAMALGMRIRIFQTGLVAGLIMACTLGPTDNAAAGTLEHTFDDPTVTGTTFNIFGRSVALDGNNVLIGASFDSTKGTFVGQAHLFDATTGSLLQTFDDPTVTSIDRFGRSVALDGDNVLIGAHNDATQGPIVGQAHLFSATTGNLLQTFDDPAPTGRDQFGSSVALDGDNVLIGARNDSAKGVSVGQAHLFSATTGNLLQTFDDPAPTGREQFGSSVALDGNNVLIGAPGNNNNSPSTIFGQAHLFDTTTGSLLRTFDDPTVTSIDQFGSSVALDGNKVLIGEPGDDTQGSNVGQAHLFDAIAGNLLKTFDDPTPTGQDGFGNSVALNGNTVLIGAVRDDTQGSNVGQAHLFDAIAGNLLQTFDDPTVTGQDGFGYAVALNNNSVLIGAPFDNTQGPAVGQAHLFSVKESPGAAVPVPATWLLLAGGLVLLRALAGRSARSGLERT